MKKSTFKLIVVAFLILFVFTYNYIYKEHRDITLEKPQYLVSAQRLFDTYQKNNQEADSIYLNKTVQVSGLVTAVTENEIVINEMITCYFDSSIESKIQVSKNIIVKGRLIGYDNLLEEIKLDQCSTIH